MRADLCAALQGGAGSLPPHEALREAREESGLEVAILEGWREVDDYWYAHNGQRVHKQAVFFVAQAHSRALSQLSQDIAAAVRTLSRAP